MPLQIRRGTEAERNAMVPRLANGELLWITDAKKLYIGDGATASSALAPVTGFTAEDAQDAAALLFTTSPTHSGISFAYDDLAGKLTATVNLSNYSGQITADVFRGTLVADDSSILVDGVAGIIPAGKVSGTFTGNVVGNLTGNTTGFHIGDIKGSVFGDDSSKIIDGVENRVFANSVSATTLSATNIQTSKLTISSNLVQALGNDIISLESNSTASTVNVKGITDGTLSTNNAAFVVQGSKGTITAPTNTVANDYIGGLKIEGYNSGNYRSVASVLGGWDATVNFADTYPRSSLYFAVGGGASVQTAVFTGQGVFYAPVIMCGSYAGSGAYPTSPAEGFIAFDSTTKHFVGYTGSAGGWKQLDN